ncbi:MAG: hypothetical protein ACFE9T_14345 [Promethearchaeota archaeon]
MEELSNEVFWKNKIKKYWKTFAICIIAVIVLAIGALLVLVWFIETTPLPGVGDGVPPNTFNDWTLNYVVGFMILICLWELLFIGVPAALFFGVGGYLWWKRLPEEEKQEFKEREKTEKKKYGKTKSWGSGGGFNIFMFIAYCIVIAVDGNYNTRFGLLDYSYFIYAWFFTFMWLLIIFGIPIAIILIIVYFKVWRKKSE